MLKKITIILSAIAALLSAVGTGMCMAQDGPRYVFRGTSGVLPMTVAAAPDDGETGGEETPPPERPELNLGMLLFTPTTGALVDATGDGKIGVGDKFEWSMTMHNYTENKLDSLAFDIEAVPYRVAVECGTLDIDESTTCAGTTTFSASDICSIVAPLRDAFRDEHLVSTVRMHLVSAIAYGETHTDPRQQTLSPNVGFVFTDAGASCPS